LIHVYSENRIDPGVFCYYREEGKNYLYDDWRKTRRIKYGKYYSFNGRFAEVLPKIISEEKYEKKKDTAIEGLSIDKNISKDTLKLLTLQYKIATSKITNLELSKKFNVPLTTIRDWKKIPEKHPEILENGGFYGGRKANIY